MVMSARPDGGILSSHLLIFVSFQTFQFSKKCKLLDFCKASLPGTEFESLSSWILVIIHIDTKQ